MSTEVSTTAPPAGEEEPTRLSLKVKSQDGVEILFKVKRTTKLGKLMQSFADKLRVQKNAYRFMYDQKRITTTSTPEQMDMEDGDVIEAYLGQDGGSRSN